jgi:hypothetical protein
MTEARRKAVCKRENIIRHCFKLKERGFAREWGRLHRNKYIYIYIYKLKVNQSRLQAWSGSEGCRKLRFPDYMTTAQDGGKVVSLTHQPPLPPGNSPGTHFC